MYHRNPPRSGIFWNTVPVELSVGNLLSGGLISAPNFSQNLPKLSRHLPITRWEAIQTARQPTCPFLASLKPARASAGASRFRRRYQFTYILRPCRTRDVRTELGDESTETGKTHRLVGCWTTRTGRSRLVPDEGISEQQESPKDGPGQQRITHGSDLAERFSRILQWCSYL
jgi:hypothetical protein